MENTWTSIPYIKNVKILRNLERVTCCQAVQTGYDRDVLLYSVKLFYSDTAEILDIAERYIKMLAHIDHISIPSIIDMSRVENEIWILFRKPLGDTVEEKYKKGSSISTQQIWAMAKLLGEGFAQLHNNEIYIGGIRAHQVFLENEKWGRFHPDIFMEKINRSIEKIINNEEGSDNPLLIFRDIYSWARLTVALLISDSNFRIMENIYEPLNTAIRESINIKERNSEIKSKQEDFLKEIIYADAPNQLKYKTFKDVLESLNNILV